MKHKDNKNGIYNINKAYNKSVSKRGWDSKDIINTTAVKQGNVIKAEWPAVAGRPFHVMKRGEYVKTVSRFKQY